MAFDFDCCFCTVVETEDSEKPKHLVGQKLSVDTRSPEVEFRWFLTSRPIHRQPHVWRAYMYPHNRHQIYSEYSEYGAPPSKTAATQSKGSLNPTYDDRGVCACSWGCGCGYMYMCPSWCTRTRAGRLIFDDAFELLDGGNGVMPPVKSDPSCSQGIPPLSP